MAVPVLEPLPDGGLSNRRPGRAERCINYVTRAANVAGVSLLIAMMLMLTADVTLRYTINSPLQGTLELTQFMLIAVVFLGLAYCQAKESHISVTVLTERLPSRLASLFNVFTLLLSMVLYSLIAWQGYLNAEHLRQVGQVSDRLRISEYPFRMLVPIGAVLLCLQFVLTLRTNIKVLFGKVSK